MRISKSKHQLAQLLIEAGVKQFPNGGNCATQDANGLIYCYVGKPDWVVGNRYWSGESVALMANADAIVHNHHQTFLSRAEFDQVVAESAEQGKPDQADLQFCESVTRTITEPVTAPTLDHLLQNYRNAVDFAAAKQAEADEAAKMRDERWKATQARASELGVRISIELVVDAEMHEPELVITDWRDLRIGDVIKVTGFSDSRETERRAELLNADSCTVIAVEEGGVHIEVTHNIIKHGIGWRLNGHVDTNWRFIRRPQQQEITK